MIGSTAQQCTAWSISYRVFLFNPAFWNVENFCKMRRKNISQSFYNCIFMFLSIIQRVVIICSRTSTFGTILQNLNLLKKWRICKRLKMHDQKQTPCKISYFIRQGCWNKILIKSFAVSCFYSVFMIFRYRKYLIWF